MTTKSMVSYWDGDSWEDFDDASGNSQLFDLSIVDTIGASRRAVATIINNSSNPQANSGASAKGPFTGVLGNFTPLKIRDKDSGEIYFYGITTSSEDEFSVSDGMYLVIEAVDYLYELKAQTTLGDKSFRQIANDRALVATLNEDLDNSETEITVTDTSELFRGMRITFASNDEDMIITEINGDTSIDVVRGVNSEFDTHSSGAAMFEAATPVFEYSHKDAPINAGTQEIETPYGSRGGLIKSFIDRKSENIRHTGPSVQVNEAIDDSETALTVIDSTGMFVGQILKVDSEEMLVTAVTNKTTITVEREYRGTTAATHSDKAILQAVDDRWSESIRNYPKNGLFKLATQGRKSILNHIRDHSNGEPHYAASADQDEFGYDYYNSPNITSTGNVLPTSFFDYFKRGTRPTSETLGPTAFGLNLHYPSPDTITNGLFVETGRQIPMLQSKVHKPQSETYTDLTVQFNSTSRGTNGDALTSKNTENFELFEVYNINTGGAGFIYPGKNLSGGLQATNLQFADSAEPFAALLSALNMGGGNLTTTETVLTLNNSGSSFNQGTSLLYVGQVITLGQPASEHMLITSINSATEITVKRGHNDTTAGTPGKTSLVRSVSIGRIQYLSAGTNTVSSTQTGGVPAEPAYMVVSDIDRQAPLSVWGTDSSQPLANNFYGVNSGHSFQLAINARPFINHGVRKTKKVNISGIVDPDTVREIIYAELLKLKTPIVRADVQTLYPAHFYIDNIPSAVSGTGTAEITVGNTLLTGTLNEGLDDSETGIDVTDSAGMYVGQRIKIDSEELVITAVNSKVLITANRAQNSTSAAEHTSGAAINDSNVDLTKYGFRTGMTVNELDSNGQPTSTYGYATWVSSTKVKVTWATGSVSASSNLRYYIPVRAGDNVRIRSDIQNYDDTMTVTGTEYIEGSGGTSTRYNLVQKSAFMPSSYGSSSLASVVEEADKDDALPEDPEFSADPNIVVTGIAENTGGAAFQFTSTNSSTVTWTAGKVLVSFEEFPFNSGTTAGLESLNSDGRKYFIYYKKGTAELVTIDDGDYAALVQENNDSDYKIIATVNYDVPFAVVELSKNVRMTTRPTILQSTKVVGEQVYADDGDATDPGFVFSGDSDTGFFRNGHPYIGATVAGTSRLLISGAGIQTTLGGGTGTAVVHDGNSLLLSNTSSKKYKRNIVDIALDSNKIDKLRPVDFEWNENSAMEGVKDIGLIAEEVHEIFPEIVNYKDNKPQSISYDKLSVILLMEIKKLKEEIEKLKENN